MKNFKEKELEHYWVPSHPSGSHRAGLSGAAGGTAPSRVQVWDSRVRRILRRASDVAATEGVWKLACKATRRVKVHAANFTTHKLAVWRSQGHVGAGVNHGAVDVAQAMVSFCLTPVEAERLSVLAPRIVLVAELTLPQCAKYRVWQRKEQLLSLGWQVEVVDWRETQQALAALQVCTRVVFYRVPAFENVRSLVAEAHALGLAPAWEVDDLIFSEKEYLCNSNIQSLSVLERREILAGVRLFRACLLACGRGIASTPALAAAMRQAGVGSVAVIENALDQQTLDIARDIRNGFVKDHEIWREIRIVYGSGTRTHDADFRQAAAGIFAAMQADPRLSLHIVGDLTLPPCFATMGTRVCQHAGRDYAAYMAMLAQADITLAPLEATLFNDAKSAIKFLEAAVLGVPAICSRRDALARVVRSGRNGILADTAEDWRTAILKLAGSARLRRKLGQQARYDALALYGPDAITTRQVLPVFGASPAQPVSDVRVMCVNVYYAPRSFGGATRVAEEMAARLAQRAGMSVSVFTTRPDMPARGHACVRYVADGVDVLASAALPDAAAGVEALDSRQATEDFTRWLAAVRPNVVHVHAVQGLGLGWADVCQQHGIPYVLTLHDAWWLCSRQFMVQANGQACPQRVIDLDVCQTCLPGTLGLAQRARRMRAVLEGAALLLAPSETHRAFYVANGIAPERIRVNRNGFQWPVTPRPPRIAGQVLRFGYVGGAEDIKGFGLLRAAFESMQRGDWELVLVDNKSALGFPPLQAGAWSVQGTVRVVPAYTPATMDDFFDGIDVLLFPSQWQESYGLTVREALARSVWVVATAPGGQAEDITAGVNGTLIPMDGQPETLRNAVESVLDFLSNRPATPNPDMGRLCTFEQQAEELGGWLEEVAHKAGSQSAQSSGAAGGAAGRNPWTTLSAVAASA